jgi:uncharacterized protein YdeI (YjbR/CyaY-like superfamily)
VDDIDGVEVVAFADAAAFELWLERHHGRSDGIWVRVAKAGSGIPSITSDELVDVGLCFGWISGQRRGLDATHYLQRYVPRRPRSIWSQVNVDKVDALAAAGRMREPGWAEVRAAQADGRWDAAYESQREAAVPPEVEAALAADPEARARFDGLGRSARYQLFLPVLQARTAATKAARVEALLAALAAPRD